MFDFQNDKTTRIIVIVVIVLVLVYLFKTSSYGSGYGYPETFSVDNQSELDSYYRSPTAGVKKYLVDQMKCSPSCCGDQWQVPFDGLDSNQIQQALIENGMDYGANTGYVRTNMTCGKGDGGVGCPCIRADAFKFIANRGNNARSLFDVDPTFFIHNDLNDSPNLDNYTPYQQLQTQKSMMVDNPKLNDLQYTRLPQSLADVQSNGSPIQPKDVQLSSVA
jgi:hypothetical protein